MKRIFYTMLVFAIGITACEKPEIVSDSAYESIKPGDPAYSFVKIINASPRSPLVNFYFDSQKFTAGLSSSGAETSGLAYGGAYPSSGYAVASPKTYTLSGRIAGAATVDPGLEVLNQSFTAGGGKYYTIFTDGAYDLSTKKISAIKILEDKIPALDTSKVLIRFVNMLTGGPGIDLVKDRLDGAKLAVNVQYSQSTDWIELPDPGPGTAPSFNFFFYNAATGQPINNVAIAVTLSKGRAYTLFVRGVAGDTAFPLTLAGFVSFL